MLQIYCPTCHGRLTLQPGETTAICDNCQNIIPVPRGYTELESAFNYAMQARIRRDFSTAETAYTDILSRHADSAAAYWGRALSRYGIEHQPIGDAEYRLVCHKAARSDFAKDRDVQQAVALAEGVEQEGYIQQTQKISALQTAVSKYAATAEPTDVLVIPGAGTDKAQVQRIQTMLNAAGYRTFAPAVELAATPRQDWEPMLFRAYSTACAMVLIAEGRDAFTPEVCFDAERFLHRIAEEQKRAGAEIPRLIVVFGSLDEYEDIPDTIFDGADDRMSLADPELAEALSRAVAKTGANYSSALREEASGHENFEYANLITSARLSLGEENFEDACNRYEQILNYNPRESQAYWGLLLARNECRDEEDLVRLGVDVREESNYKNALRFASEREQQIYRSVAEKALETLTRDQEQEREDARMAAEQERQREENACSVARDLEQKVAVERRETRKGKQRLKTFAVALAVIAVIGGLCYRRYSTTIGASARLYKAAQSLYSSGDYKAAAEQFESLGNYKDSENMYQQSISRYYVQCYHEAMTSGEDMNNRKSAVNTLKNILPYVPEAQETLDQWLEEGEAYYYEHGADYTAFMALAGYGTDSQAFVDLWRDAISMGLVCASIDYDALAIVSMDGTLRYNECQNLTFEDGSARSCSLSYSGESAAVVRADGTVYVTGEIAASADVSGWAGVKSVQTTDREVVALKEDGTLISSRSGTLATGIRQFDFPGDVVIAARTDGTVFCSSKEVQKALADWSNIAHVVMVGSTLDDAKVLAVTEDNELLEFGCDLGYPTTDVVAPVRNGNALAIRQFDSKWFLIAFGEPGDIQVTLSGEAVLTQIKNDARDIQLRTFVRDVDEIGIPNLSD